MNLITHHEHDYTLCMEFSGGMGKRAWNSGFAGGMGKRSASDEEYYEGQGKFGASTFHDNTSDIPNERNKVCSFQGPTSRYLHPCILPFYLFMGNTNFQ